MRHLPARVGQMQRLAVFEAAARLGTFTAAAGELGMTQPAVTHQIRALERDLGIQLFRRTANRAFLTERGVGLHEAVSLGFAAIESELERIDADSSVFVLAANPEVAQRYLVPHLDGLTEATGGSDIRLWLFDRNAELSRGVFDAAIHVGNGAWDDWSSLLLFPEIALPVASPSLADRLGLSAETSPDELSACPLLFVDETDRPWMSWPKWFAHFDLVPPQQTMPVVYNNDPLVLQEAIAGHGVALAWRYLVDGLVDQGVLTPAGPEVHAEGSGYYLIWPKSTGDEVAGSIARWLGGLIPV